MILLLPLTLVLFSLGPYFHPQVVQAGDANYGEPCSVNNQRLQIGTYQFVGDCNSVTFCNSSALCDHKGCRRDEFPFGYSNPATIPNRCDPGLFCPDEEDKCQPLLPVGSPCQFNRDDECEGPPNFKDLADHTGFGLNVNGSVCLNNVCQWANVTVGEACEIENTGYIIYSGTDEQVEVVSRGNCRVGLYCDVQQKQCIQQKDLGESCDADKECLTFNCLDNGTCGKTANTPEHVATWVYVVVALCIFGGMVATLIGLYYLHRGHRNSEREKRMQYWREQNAFRQNIMQMQESARHSLMSLSHNGVQGSSPRSTMYSRDGVQSEDSQIPMLNSTKKSSALRHHFSDDGFDASHESLVADRSDRQYGGKF
ncbi:hypothetical protein BDW22DRAFT_1427253 [Trametopsis cervina]|nr:hypothetical protein BDW22DRAFT_1427253 [Trametopsis cervina]